MIRTSYYYSEEEIELEGRGTTLRGDRGGNTNSQGEAERNKQGQGNDNREQTDQGNCGKGQNGSQEPTVPTNRR